MSLFHKSQERRDAEAALDAAQAALEQYCEDNQPIDEGTEQYERYADLNTAAWAAADHLKALKRDERRREPRRHPLNPTTERSIPTMPTPTDTLTAALGEHLPLHGPYDGDTTVAAAEGSADLARYLNYATQHPGGVPYPATADRILGGLRDAVDRMPQTLAQLAARGRDAAGNPNAYVYRDDRDHDEAAVNAAVDELAGDLAAARQAAVVLASLLSTAQSCANRIGMDEPDPWDAQ